MVTLGDVLLGGVLPGIVAVAALVAVWKLTANAASSWRTAAVASFVVGMWALDSQGVGVASAIAKSVKITEAKDFLPLLAILAVIPDAVATFGKRGSMAAWMLRVGLCLFVPWRLLWGTRFLPKVAVPANFNTGAWSTGEAITYIGLIAAALVLGWALIRAENTEWPKLRSALAILTALAASVAIGLSGSISQAQLMGVLVAVLTGCGIAAGFLLGRGPDAAAGPLVVAFGSVLLLAHFFSSLKLMYAVLLLVGFVVGAGWFFPRKKWSAAARCAVCVTMIGAATGMAVIDYQATKAETTSDPYSNL